MEDNRRGYNNGKHRNEGKYGNKDQKYVRKTNQVKASNEVGFKGPTDNWFNGKKPYIYSLSFT